MPFLLRWGNGGLYIGRDHYRDMDFTISLAWHKRADAREWELQFHRNVSASWDWLPKAAGWDGTHWPHLSNSAREFGQWVVYSRSWTGRPPLTVTKWRWDWSFRNISIA